MKYDVGWRSDAARDVHRAFDWYDKEAPEHVERLQESLREAENQIRDSPYTFRRVHLNFRRHVLRKFPYELWYRIQEEREAIQILAFKHGRQDDAPFIPRLS